MRGAPPASVLEPRTEEARERLLNAYQAAVHTYAELQRLRPWAAGRRRELAQDLETLIRLADETRDELAAIGGGYIAPARSLRDILDDLGREVYGSTIDNAGHRIRG